MVLGKHLLVDRRTELLGLAGSFYFVERPFRDTDINMDFSIAHPALSENIGLYANLFGGGLEAIKSIGAAKAIATSGAVKAGALFGSATLGTGVAIAAAVVALVSLMNAMGWFAAWDKSTWDAEATERVYNRMTSKDQTHSLPVYMANIGRQLSTSKLQDEMVQQAINQMFVMLVYYKSIWNAERAKDWKSKTSQTNTDRLSQFADDNYNKFLNKVKSLEVVYEVRMDMLSFDFTDPRYQAAQKFGFSPVAGIFQVPFVTLIRRHEAKNAIIPLDDFLFAERDQAQLLIASWADEKTRKKLIEQGTRINAQWLPYGYTPVVSVGRNGEITVDGIALDADGHDTMARDRDVRVNVNQWLILRKYYLSDASVSMQSVKDLIQKTPDAREILQQYQNAGLDVEAFTSKPELNCWLKNYKPELYEQIISHYKDYFGYGKRYTTTNPKYQILITPCSSGATPNTGGAVLPTPPTETKPPSPSVPTPSVPATPNTGGAVLPTPPAETKPPSPSVPTPSVPATPNTGGAVLPTPPAETKPPTPSVPTPPTTQTIEETTIKKSGFPWWLLLIPAGLWAMSKKDKKQKPDT